MKSNGSLVFLILLYYEVLCIGRYSGTLIKPSFTKEHLKWAAFYKNSGVGNKEIYKQKSITQHANNKSNAALLWDKKNCLPKSTALFPVPSDCRKYIKCNKGQGSVNSCAEGTLFNPNSFKCDSPDKVQCLNRNSSVFESLFPNKSSNQNSDLNTQSTNQYQFRFTDKYQLQSSNPLPGSQFIVDLQKPKAINFTDYSDSVVNINYSLPVGGIKSLVGSNIVVNQHVHEFTNQYRLQSSNPLPGSKFIVDLQKPKEINLTDYSDSAVNINYSLPVEGNKPLVGSNIVVNQHIDEFNNQYRLQSTNPLPGTQFIVDLQKPKVINFTDYSDSVVKINYSSPVGSNKPVVGSNIVVRHQSKSTSIH